MKLVWDKTGDFINLEILNHKVFQFLIEYWKSNNSNKFLPHTKFSLDITYKKLKKSLKITNKILKFFKIDDLEIDLNLDQNTLNLLHEKWVILQRKHPMISALCEKKFEGGKFHFDNINHQIHILENGFNFLIGNNDLTAIKNNFDDITTFNFANIYLEYKNPGRQTFDKWINYDNNVYDIDKNDFSEFYGFVNINLNRPYKKLPPPEYIKWCQDRKINAYGDKISLANFENLEYNIKTYRELFLKNFTLSNNYVSFEL